MPLPGRRFFRPDGYTLANLLPGVVDKQNRGKVGMTSRGVAGYIASMSSEALELKERMRAEYHSRWEAVETAKAHELAAMTEERAGEIIQLLGAAGPWRADPEWSGLVEQQALFLRGRRT